MNEEMIQTLEEGNEEEIQKSLREFLSRHSQAFHFPHLASGDRRRKLWQAIFQKLGDPSLFKCHALCLEAVRILSREKFGLDEVLRKEMVDTMICLAGLVTDEEAVSISNKQNDVKVIVEAQKCLCNLIFNSSAVQRMCCNNGCVEGIVVRLKTYKEPELPHEVKFLDMRMLFLLTALCADVRPKLRNELHGLTYLVEVLDLILKSSAERRSQVNPVRPGRRVNFARGVLWEDSVPYLDDNDVDLACEVLKILFNLTVHVDKGNLDEEEEAHFMRLVSILHDILISPTHSKEKRDELQSHTVNLLTNMPPDSYEELLTPLNESAACVDDNKDFEYDGQNMEGVVVLLHFLDKRLDKPLKSLKEALSPILTCLCECAQSNRVIRKFLRTRVLPPLRDVYNRPEQGDTFRNKLCRLLTSPVTDVKDLVADFLFILCKENVARLIKYTGYGNAAGLLASRGLMLGGRGKGDYSSESEDSETEEYREAKDRINPVIGCYEEPRPDPMAGMSEEQKEYEAIQLVNMMDKLARDGVVTPMRMGEDGKPRPVEHILELCEDPELTVDKHREFEPDSD